MVQSTGKCKICGKTFSVGGADTPPGIAAEGVMETTQEHIFRDHCNDEFELVEGAYSSVSDAWEYV